MALHDGNDLLLSELICTFREVISAMPVIRYFLFASAGLLALLFLTDAYLPHRSSQPPAAAASKPVIRIARHKKSLSPVVIEATWPGSPMEAN